MGRLTDRPSRIGQRLGQRLNRRPAAAPAQRHGRLQPNVVRFVGQSLDQGRFGIVSTQETECFGSAGADRRRIVGQPGQMFGDLLLVGIVGGDGCSGQQNTECDVQGHRRPRYIGEGGWWQ
jgi:hypothetical protein